MGSAEMRVKVGRRVDNVLPLDCQECGMGAWCIVRIVTAAISSQCCRRSIQDPVTRLDDDDDDVWTGRILQQRGTSVVLPPHHRNIGQQHRGSSGAPLSAIANTKPSDTISLPPSYLLPPLILASAGISGARDETRMMQARGQDGYASMHEIHRNHFDILFIQEPPWSLICKTVSSSNKDGGDVIGVPKHPEWITVVPVTKPDCKPRVLAYCHNRLTHLQPSLCRDIIDHPDIIALSVFTHGQTLNFMNIYSDDQNTVIFHVAGKSGSLPSFVYIGGDFNYHSSVWDPKESSHRMVPVALLESAADLGLELAMPDNPGPMLYPYNQEFCPLVIDLIFLRSQDVLACMPHREIGIQGSSDHIPISAVILLLNLIDVGTT
ncbi:hypothetical protein BDN70DRAFT_901416 [Pholiota conissans]|uniref:Endonuclease/exonuclease/phosphatase domain-containing protein n=1 Tax=Pholiota conissans TaxID=109636 RepID=A0A9P5YL83_9AGAR|nr:hypothetical protein BDN70DRAFT_901416 [Pholiota conissans]